MKTVIVIHGWEGYPEEGWRPWLKEQFTNKGYKVLIPAMPNTKNPELIEWLNYLRKIIKNTDEDLILIGHSLGVITILKYIENLKKGKIAGAIFVAGFSYDLEFKGYKNEISNFFKSPIDFNKVKKHCKKFFVLHSEKDPWVPVKHAYLLKEKLNAETVVKKGKLHFSGDEGITKLAILIKFIEKI